MLRLPRKNFAVGAFLASSALTAPAYAQYVPPVNVPPVHSRVDQFGVDLVTRYLVAQTSGSISIGQGGPGGLSVIWTNSNSNGSVLNSGLNVSGSKYSVYVAGATTTFTLSGTLGAGTFSNDQGGGETLAYSSVTSQYTLTSGNGAVLVLTSGGQPMSLTYPAGEQVTWNYDTGGVLRSVTTNLGYQYRPTYTGTPYQSVSKAVLFNMNNETCDPLAVSCTLINTWPTIDFSAATINGHPVPSWSSQADSSCTGCTILTETIPVTSTTNRTLVYKEDANNRVTSVTDGVGTWNYSYATGGGATFTDFFDGVASRRVRVTPWDTTTGLVTNDVLIGNNGTSGSDGYQYSYDSYQRIQSVTHNGVTTTYSYDTRGNIKQTVTQDTTGSTTNEITTSAVYPDTCTNPKICNKPTSTTDENTNTTSYTYDPNSGGVWTKTLPAVTSAGVGTVSPVITYNYTNLNETWKNGAGATVTGSPVYRLTSVSRCMSQSTCSSTVNPNDEVRTTIGYDTTHGLQPSSVTTGTNASASPVLQATTAYTYDLDGDVYTIDGPPTGAGYTTWFSYDYDRRITGTIGPAPGNGQPNRAISVSYTLDGNVDTTSMGTASGQSYSALGAMTVLQKVQVHYNAQGLKDKETAYDNTGAIGGVAQYNYTPIRNLQCVAVRNNATTWNSQSDACAQTSTATDLLTKYKADDLGRTLEVRKGYTSDTQTADMVNTWNNALLQTQLDGKGNPTAYSYDTFNRLQSTCYPSTTTAGASSTTDCAKVTLYDAHGNIKTRQLRDGTSVTYNYDAVNRLTSKTIPEGTTNYAYDLLGHPKTISEPGYTLTLGYDALGRQTFEGQGWGSISRSFDLAGRLTGTTWWDGFYVNYDRLVTGEISKIRENGATSGVGVLASYSYDALGNRSSLIYGNGATQSYGYDSLYRLHTLTTDLEGTATTNDVTHTVYWNPAMQITSLVRSNNNYVWTGATAANQNYSVNALNQYVSGSTAPYDARGNLNQSGGVTYSYTSENLLKSASNGVSLYYDPVGRLVEYDTSVSTRFMYDGPEVAVEVDNPAGNILRRYVRGDGPDEVLVWYEGSGMTNRRFLSADERGSIIALTDSTGAVLARNTYDEYGLPGSGNLGKFQYTGQMWLPELGMNNYKARIYSPSFGRFLQTDPIGYGDGMNWYAYAHNDPVNGSDPLGLDGTPAVPLTPPYAGDQPCGGMLATICGGSQFNPDSLGHIDCTKGFGCDLGGLGDPGIDLGPRGPGPGYVPRQVLDPKVPEIRLGCNGGRAAGISKAITFTGYAHKGFEGISKIGGGGAAAEHALGPISRLLDAAAAVADFASSRQNGEPMDVAVVRAVAPVVGGIVGTAGGAVVGGAAMGAAGSVVPILGTATGLAAGAVAGGAVGGTAGEKLGAFDAEGYAKWRGYGTCQE